MCPKCDKRIIDENGLAAYHIAKCKGGDIPDFIKKILSL